MYAEREAAVEDMPKYTKYLEFSQKERTAIRERDNYMCIFCQVGYRMPPANEMGKNMLELFKSYLDEFYPDFADRDRKYDKWRFLKGE